MTPQEPVAESPPGPPAGLCGTCRYARRIVTTHGSTFRLCERSVMDPRYPRYPVLPVLRCDGFEPSTGTVRKTPIVHG